MYIYGISGPTWSLYTYDWILVNGTPGYGIGLADTLYIPRVYGWSTDPRILGLRNLVSELSYTNT